MGTIVVDKSISLDGFITGPNPRPEAGLGDTLTSTGAVIMGRKSCDIIDTGVWVAPIRVVTRGSH